MKMILHYQKIFDNVSSMRLFILRNRKDTIVLLQGYT